jgi:DNA invertase Pin-like site-specific DNA recombinase
MPFQAILFDGSIPVYRRVAEEARRLRLLGLSLAKIARHLGYSKMTVIRALALLRTE